jgi:hypothetical protein
VLAEEKGIMEKLIAIIKTNPDRCIYRIQKDAVYVCIHPDAYGRVVSERCLDVGASCPIPGKLKKEGKQA